jgi:hypothetical protein
MAKKKFSVSVEFVFKGTIEITCESKEQAREYIEKHTGLCLGGNIHTTLPDEDIDWNFDTHSIKKIGRVTKS